MIGQTLAHYHILEKLGEGGMGVVYKARDTHLDRLVAIKLLPQDRSADPERRRRFIQEARSASALNHPNIITVYDVASDNDVDFIAMECVSGRTLAEMIGRKGLKLRDVLNYGAQIADALAAAHAAGIVHRDLKPGNVMVTERGQVKVLDFGLAKLTEPAPVDEDAPTVSRLPRTEEGLIAGTAAYMSPEQAEGQPVDARSDIFSFGAVLYEMATGRRAFSGQNAVSTLSAVLHQEPAPIEEAPAELEKLIARCLRKDPNRRLQHMVDVKIALEDLKEESDSGKLPSSAIRPAPRVNRWATVVPVVAVLALILAGGAVWWFWPHGARPGPASDLKPVKLTANPSDYPISGAALAPDSKFLAYSDPRGIHLRLMATGETESLPDTEGMIVAGWSADGAKVTARRQAGGEAASYWSISIIGSGARRPITRGLPAPDGSSTLFVEGSELWVESRAGRRQLGTVETSQNARGTPERFVWSADSRRVVFIRFLPAAGGQNELVTFDVATDREEVIAPAGQLPRFIQAMAWAGDNRLIFAAPELLSNAPPTDQSDLNLWDLRLDTKAAARRLTNWSGFHIASLSVTPDGRKLSFLETKYQEDVWVAGLEAENRRLVNPRRLTFDERNDRPISWTADSRSVVFASNRSGTTDAFLQDLDRDVAVLLANGPGNQTVPRATGDGRWILYFDNQTSRRMMRVARAGAAPEEVGTFPEVIDIRCGLMPTSPCIAEIGLRQQSIQIHLLDPVAGLGRLLFKTPVASGSPTLSPAGDRFAYVLPPEPGRPRNRIRIVSADGTVDRDITAAGATALNSLDYSADGKGLFTSDYSTDLGARLLYVSLDGKVTILWNNRGSVRTWGVPSPDGKWIALLGATQESNVWVLEGF